MYWKTLQIYKITLKTHIYRFQYLKENFITIIFADYICLEHKQLNYIFFTSLLLTHSVFQYSSFHSQYTSGEQKCSIVISHSFISHGLLNLNWKFPRARQGNIIMIIMIIINIILFVVCNRLNLYFIKEWDVCAHLKWGEIHE